MWLDKVFIWVLIISFSDTITAALMFSIFSKAEPDTRTVFGVERKIQIPKDIALDEDDIKFIEERCGDNCEHFWIDSCVKDTKLHCRKWLPPQKEKPKAIVVHAHGIQTHSGNALIMPDGRKFNSALRAERFNKEGYAVYSHDYYGHGYSEGTRWLIPETWKNNLEDYRTFVNTVASQHESDVPIFLMGESYGACLSIHLARKFQDDPESGPRNGIDSIILTSSAIEADLPAYPVVLALRYIGAPLFPTWIPFFMPNKVSPDRIWRDPAVLELKANDRAKQLKLDNAGNPFRLGTALNLLESVEAVRQDAIPGLMVPYCLIHGTQDGATPIGGAEYMWQTATMPSDREYHPIDGARHDIFSDPAAEEVMQIVTDWTRKRLSAR